MMRIAAAPYLNSRPLTFGLDVTPCSPSEGARRLAEGEVDVALVPLASVARAGDWVVIPELCVAAVGPVESVLVLADCPPEAIEAVALDASSRTSAVLARLCLPQYSNIHISEYKDMRIYESIRWESRPPEAIEAQIRGRTAGLLIGDRALEISARRRFATTIDLGAAWFELTGLPIVFAVWAAADEEAARRAAPLLRAAAARGLAATEALGRREGEPAIDPTPLDPEQARRYLARLRFRLGAEELSGAEELLGRAAEARLLPRTRLRLLREEAARPLEPEALRGASASTSAPRGIEGLLERGAKGERLSAGELVALHDGAELVALGAAAHRRRTALHPTPVVTYIVDRNINYTNVCTTACRFCAFYRPVGHEEGWTLDRAALADKLGVLRDAGGIQVLLQGGLNPALPLEWYEDLFRWMKREYPSIALHALSPEEILHLARLSGLELERVIARLVAAGLDSIPGGGAEILVDRVRRRIAALKCTSAEWLEVMRVAHRLGLRSSATMMYAIGERTRDRIEHLLKLRDLQDETGGFTAFICWPFQPGNTKLAGDDLTASAPSYLRQVALARLALDNIPNLQASWPTMGPAVGQVALLFGANDFGSVMFEENVVSSAGTLFSMDAPAIERHIAAAGYQPRRRNMRYEELAGG